MKDAALRHLMLLTGRAVATVHTAERARVDNVCTSLHVMAEGRGAYRLEYRLDGQPVTLSIEPRRFDFYRRGDVASLNERRTPDLDLRTTNWHAALTTWSEILGRDGLTSTVTVRSILPNSERTVDRAARLREIAGVVGVVGLAGVAARRRWGGVAAGVAASALAVVADEGRTRQVAGVAGGVAALVAARRPADPASIVGALALAAFAADLPGTSAGPAALPLRLATAGLAGGASPGSAVALSLAASADAVGGALGRDRRSIGAPSAAVAAAFVAFAGQAVRRRTRGVGGAGVNPMWGVAVAAGLVAENVARSLEGTRARLAPLVVPVAVAASLAPRRGRALSMSLGAGLLAASAVSRLAAAMAPTAASVAVAPVAEELVVLPTPVVVRPARGRVAAGSGAVVDDVDTSGTEVASSS